MPRIIVPDGATVSPASGEAVNLTRPVVYIVRGGASTKLYTVKVEWKRNPALHLWDNMYDQSYIPGYQVSYGRSGG